MIFVNDLPRMTAFYADTLRLKPVESKHNEDYLEFDAGGATFALHSIPDEMRCDRSSPVTPRETSPLKLSFEVPDMDAELRRLESLGVTLLRRPWGGCDAVDPEGNVFGISAAA